MPLFNVIDVGALMLIWFPAPGVHVPVVPAIARVPFDCNVIVAPGVATVEKITVPLLR